MLTIEKNYITISDIKMEMWFIRQGNLCKTKN